ncbi:mitochondrial import inner membrane translocase subunit TIM44 isoform X2 [Hippopotamus amphibius kiboko]|uniref:mitochondrial import inner membrane translocase subunit TIM44 isoform X2 n=1 Tax=Hippopotamus amphibius kiboko TaxID=575201 RepID=UPI002596D036|nr:mitochondrial import inner membrane translocase subunit TIM44 isoform X2 [Hippopotamus amphibius kiboko]
MAAAALRGGWCRCPRCKSYSSGNRKGFLSGLLDNIKQELAKNKEMKESIKKFRDEARKLEESDALQEARRKYRTIESETMRTSEVIRKKLGEISGTVKESLDEVSKSDLGRKIKEGVEEAAKTAKQSAESVSKGGEKLGRTAAFKALSQGVESVKKEIDESVLGQTGPYRRPERLRKRKEFAGEKFKEEKVFEANEEALGVVLHKDSKWYQQWKDFRDNNVVFNRFFEMKMKYDESDNAFIRASRVLTDKVTDLLGGLFSKTEMSEVLTEILRVDPAFDKDRFLQQCENDIIPNVLEAMISGELDILKDWCYEADPQTQTQTDIDRFPPRGRAARPDEARLLPGVGALGPGPRAALGCVAADLQPASSPDPAGQGAGPPVPLPHPGHRQHRPGHGQDDGAGPCADHHLPGPDGDGDQEPQRRGGGGRPGQGTANAVRVGALPRPGRAQPLCGLAALGHLRLQHRAGPLSAAATAGASGAGSSLQTRRGLASTCSN